MKISWHISLFILLVAATVVTPQISHRAVSRLGGSTRISRGSGSDLIARPGMAVARSMDELNSE
jgi:hypothetical protein